MNDQHPAVQSIRRGWRCLCYLVPRAFVLLHGVAFGVLLFYWLTE